MKNVLCYGDSNTWGCTPGVLCRFPKDTRWTGILAKKLGNEYNLIEDGINGRTTVWDDPENMCRNGATGLGYALYRSKPLDLVVLMLGTNDLNYTNIDGYYHGIRLLAEKVLNANQGFPGTSDVFPKEPKLLLISPIALHKDMEKYAESLKFPAITQKVANELNVPWLDAAKYAEASPADGCHMDAENHLRLAQAIYEKIKEIL